MLTYTSEAAFLAATSNLAFESFESSAPQALGSGGGSAVVTSAFTVTPQGPATLGVQDGPDSPGSGFGSVATDGTHYLFSYLPNQPTGTLRFDLSRPTTSFGLNLIDLGEADGTLSFVTDTGDAAGGITAFTFPPNFNNGNVLFFGFTQTDAFTQVLLTVTGIDDAFGIDKVYMVAEPGGLALLLAGLAAFAARSRRRVVAPGGQPQENAE